MQYDDVYIAKEELSRKELFLKDRLYTKKLPNYLTSDPKQNAAHQAAPLPKNFGKDEVQ